MNLSETLRMPVGLAANKLRSVLTTPGIIIGVGAVITLLSVVESTLRHRSVPYIGSNLRSAVPGNSPAAAPRARVCTHTLQPTMARCDGAARHLAGRPTRHGGGPGVSRVAAVKAGKREITLDTGGVEPEYVARAQFGWLRPGASSHLHARPTHVWPSLVKRS